MYGWTAEKAVEDAREQVALLVGADPREIIWTSGATEGNNLALKGAAQFYKTKGKHIITVKTEHKAVLDTVRELERQGFEATYLQPQDNGLITIEQPEINAGASFDIVTNCGTFHGTIAATTPVPS